MYNVDIDRSENNADYITLLNIRYDTFLKSELSFEEIHKAMKQIKENTATGCYNRANQIRNAN